MRIAKCRTTLAAWAALALAPLAACGDDGGGDRGRAVVQGRPDPAHARAVERDPYQVTCGDLARQTAHPDSAKLVIRAEFALAQDPVLREVVERETLNRVGRSVYFGLVRECRGRSEEFGRGGPPWPACAPASTSPRATGRAECDASRTRSDTP